MTSSDVTQIKIGKHKVGFVGLKSALEELTDTHAQKSDDIIAVELFNRLSKNNYIPENVKDKYGRAFVREFRKHLGQPFEEDASEGIEIKVLGQGCRQCDRLEMDVMGVLSDMNVVADLEHVRDLKEIASYQVMGVPALVINGKVMCVGKVPSKNKIRKWLEAAADI